MDNKSKLSIAVGGTSIKATRIAVNTPSYTSTVENFLLVWLDRSSDDKNIQHYHNAMETLRQVISAMKFFIDADECIEFITNNNKDKIFFIVSGSSSPIILSVVQDISQVNSVYIFDENENGYNRWTPQWSKVRGVFTDITTICDALKQDAHQCDQNSISFSFVKSINGFSKKNLDELDKSFMYTQILKEILLAIDFEQIHINEFLTYCREQFSGDTSRLKNVDKLEKEYHYHEPIWWYTSDSFLYTMLNKALRTMEVNVIIQIGFFIRALHEHIAKLHLEQYGKQTHSKTFTVFRGQGFSRTDFDQLRKTSGGLISFNNFLSTSLDEAVSTAFAESNTSDPDLVGVLFKITVNPSVPSTPFSNVTGIGYFESEGEILFSMHSVFRIVQVKQINESSRLWQVDLTLTNDNDPELHTLTESIREETFPGQEGWYRLGQVLIKLGEFNKAEQVYNVLLGQISGTSSRANIYFQLGWIKDNQGEYEVAVSYYKKLIEIIENTLPLNYHGLAYSYNNVGMVYNKMGEYSKALYFHERALEIRQKMLPSNDDCLAVSYNNIGRVYDNTGNYSKARSCYEKAFEIWQEILPPNHPNLALCHNNICGVYINMNEYSKALSHIQRAHEIQRRILPGNHPDLTNSLNNIGGIYGNMCEYSKAISYFDEALKIIQETVSPNHPTLATLYNNIASMYDKMGEHWKALFYFQIAHIIKQKTLPPNHPHIGASYSNIGIAYKNVSKSAKALSCFEKAVKIFQESLHPNHPHLAILYSNIGVMYSMKGSYQKAIWYHEKVLEISKQTLPPNHPNLVNFYYNIGGLYNDMGDYSKALSFFERALEIGQHALPEDHPNLRLVRQNIERLRIQLLKI